MDPNAFTAESPGSLTPIEDDCFAYVPGKLPPPVELSWELVTELSEADRALSELAGTARTLPNPLLLIRAFIAREAVLSSRIEGTQASLSDLYMYQGSAREKSVPHADVVEVVNYVHALEHGISRLEELPLSIRLVKEVHEILMNGVRGESRAPGELRRIQNWIGATGTTKKNATYVPPPVHEMNLCLNDLERYLHETDKLPVLIRIACIHYQFEAIHPFLDGNGRVGRLLITLILCSQNILPQPLLYLSAYFERHRRQYYELLLNVSQRGDWQSWIMFFLRGVSEQSRDAIKRSHKLLDLNMEYREHLHSTRATGLQLQLIDLLFVSPAVTVALVCEELKITPRAAQQNLDKLMDLGVIREVTGKQRNRIFMAQKILEITDAREA